MNPTTFMSLFATKVSSFTIVAKNCILSEAGFKLNDDLTYFEAKSSNVQFLYNFAFPFFKFLISHLSEQGFQQLFRNSLL